MKMALYTEPPRGNISHQKLEAFALKRLHFIIKVMDARGDVSRLQDLACEEGMVKGSECLITGSAKDKVSHFILRLLLGGDCETQAFFCTAETALFDFHFSCMSEEEMDKFFRKIDKILNSRSFHGSGLIRPTDFTNHDMNNILRVFSNIRQSAGSWKEVRELYMAQNNKSVFSVPFQSVFHLLKKRQVRLEKGMARVPFSRLREVVTEQFSSLMQVAAKQATGRLPSALADERLKVLWRKLKHLCRSRYSVSCAEGVVPGLCLDQVDAMATHYPLCMSSLLRSLRQKHRLGHHARVQLTLFLKDLGLPVHHALALWQQEYSQQAGSDGQCNHTWKKDGRRYTYNIRHLYGLEGARRNYRGHCCESLQQRILGCNEEGGCPFSHWDDTSMSAELSRLGLHISDVRDILSLQKAGRISGACQRTLHCRRVNRTRLKDDDLSVNTANPQDEDLSVNKANPQVCQQVLFSTSPDNLYRNDCCVSKEKNVPCHSENFNLPNVGKKKTGETDDETKVSAPHENDCRSKKDETLEVGNPTTWSRKEGTCKRKFPADKECQVCALSATGVGDVEVSVLSAGTSEPGAYMTHCKHTYTSLNPKRCRVTPDESHAQLLTDAGISGCEHLVKPAPEKDLSACHSDTKTSELESGQKCFDHDVCPSQAVLLLEQSLCSKTVASVQISKPAHYFQLSYQCFLESLKSE